jgi:hypothetical protein
MAGAPGSPPRVHVAAGGARATGMRKGRVDGRSGFRAELAVDLESMRLLK